MILLFLLGADDLSGDGGDANGAEVSVVHRGDFVKVISVRC